MNGLNHLFKLVLVALVALSFSCGEKKEVVTIKVSFWGDNKQIGIIKSIIEPWDKKRKDIEVVLEHIPSTRYMQKIQTEFAAGVGPDVVFAEVNNYIELYSRDMLIPLNSFVSNDPSINLSDYYPELIRRFTRDGNLYVIGRDIAPFACIYYNKDLFDQAGIPYPKDNWNTDDLLRIAKQLTKKEGQIITQFGFYGWAWWNWLYTFGGGFVDDYSNPTKLLLSSHKSRQALKFYHDLMYKHQVSPTPAADQTGSQLFMTGRLAMYSSGIWESPEFRTIQSFNWDVAMFPKGPDGTRSFASGGSGYGISKSCKHPEAAWEVLKALADINGQKKMAKMGLTQPAIRSLVKSEHFNENGEDPLNKRMLDEAVKYINFDPFHPDWYKFNNTHIGMHLDLYFRNKATLDEALKNIDAAAAEEGLFK